MQNDPFADDNADMRDYLKRLLSAHWSVEAVADGDAALAAIRRRPPDLVLSDVVRVEVAHLTFGARLTLSRMRLRRPTRRVGRGARRDASDSRCFAASGPSRVVAIDGRAADHSSITVRVRISCT